MLQKVVLFLALSMVFSMSALASDDLSNTSNFSFNWQIAGGDTTSQLVLNVGRDLNALGLDEALSTVNKRNHLTSIALGRLVKIPDSRLQSQLLGYLAANHKEMLHELLISRGERHQQALATIAPGFKKAVLQTALVRNIEWQLAQNGYEIIQVSLEKFFVIRQSGLPQFDAQTWLVVAPNSADEAQ